MLPHFDESKWLNLRERCKKVFVLYTNFIKPLRWLTYDPKLSATISNKKATSHHLACCLNGCTSYRHFRWALLWNFGASSKFKPTFWKPEFANLNRVGLVSHSHCLIIDYNRLYGTDGCLLAKESHRNPKLHARQTLLSVHKLWIIIYESIYRQCLLDINALWWHYRRLTPIRQRFYWSLDQRQNQESRTVRSIKPEKVLLQLWSLPNNISTDGWRPTATLHSLKLYFSYWNSAFREKAPRKLEICEMTLRFVELLKNCFEKKKTEFLNWSIERFYRDTRFVS